MKKLQFDMTQLTSKDWDEVFDVLKGYPDGERVTRGFMKAVLEQLARSHNRADAKDQKQRIDRLWSRIHTYLTDSKGMRLSDSQQIPLNYLHPVAPMPDVGNVVSFPTQTQ